jgi:hypothetical protein
VIVQEFIPRWPVVRTTVTRLPYTIDQRVSRHSKECPRPILVPTAKCGNRSRLRSEMRQRPWSEPTWERVTDRASR